jgi:hypothetical protein
LIGLQKQSFPLVEDTLNALTLFGAGAVTVMLLAYALEKRSAWWVLVFAVACGASSLYGWLAGTWPFGFVEGIWALVALRRWWLRRSDLSPRPTRTEEQVVPFH